MPLNEICVGFWVIRLLDLLCFLAGVWNVLKNFWHVENRVSILKMASDYQRKQNKHTNTHTSFGRSDASFRSMRYFLHFWHCFHCIGKIPEIICSQKHNDTTCTQCARMKFYGDCFDFILIFAVGIIAFWRRHSSDISAENVFALPVVIDLSVVFSFRGRHKNKKRKIFIYLYMQPAAALHLCILVLHALKNLK